MLSAFIEKPEHTRGFATRRMHYVERKQLHI
jgi:hypothetical protein